ncbi:H(+)/Cl(-) exchange transporter 7-like isoform X2 [Clavelina lepadiformis]|uniref:H(+)/Cl(-) exchange transporter 7-like isoform X2 n=1 Tax=Clavelina lepadiformis TaxID=159417 RepID=UPI004040ECC2
MDTRGDLSPLLSNDEDDEVMISSIGNHSEASCRFLSTPNRRTSDGFFENGDSGIEALVSDTDESVRPKKTADYEALDYDTIENELYYAEETKMSHRQWKCIQIQRWLICVLIGITTGLVAVIINISIIQLTELKMKIVTQAIEKCVKSACLYQPLLIWITINAGLVMIAALLTVFVAPVAAGSGIPQIKCFLNGVKVPNVVRLKTFFTKVVGIIASVSGGLAVGKEGPMIHAGAVLAAGISQGRSITFKLTFPLFEYFRNDREKRDFVCAGAAAGVAAAFGAPVGGVLFSLEEASSFWNQALTWRIFLCSILSSYSLNFFMSLYHHHGGDLAYPGLINFGKFEGTYEGFELPIFFFMGVIGGLLGALFNAINHKITIFRNKYVTIRFLKVVEVIIVSVVSATIAFMMMFLSAQCNPLGQDINVDLQFLCEDGQYNTMASLFFTPPEDSVKSLFHDPLGSFQPLTIIIFVFPYFFVACWTYGLQVPSGLFIPALLIGAAWGRLIGICMNAICPDCLWSQDVAKYALIGAAAQLGGTVRMTISLTVILIEATGNISYSLPLMTVLMIAKWVGDFFNQGIYDKHVHLAKVPILEWEPPPLSINIHAREVMGTPAVTVREVCLVKDICRVLSDPHNCHSGYPVTNEEGKFRGFILRSQLLILLKHKVFMERSGPDDRLELAVFRDSYPRYFPLSIVNVSEDEQRCHIDIRPYLNPAPYTISERASLPRIFRLFRALGLRHLVVVNDNFEVVGIVTRKDIWKWGHHGKS